VLPADSPVDPRQAPHLDVDRDRSLFADGVYAWTLQTFAVLHQRGRVPVTTGFEFRPEAINVAHASQLADVWPQSAAFVVCVRGDYRPVSWAQMHVVQNQLQAGPRALWLPHWPQPGLIGRQRRRNAVETVAFAGRGYYLAGNRHDWEAAIGALGCRFEVLPAERWHDLSSVDVLLAIRSFDERRWQTKPPTKLLNAWHARIPLIGGQDSAYAQVGEPGIDYLTANSMAEALEWIRVLRHDPNRYRDIVTAGAERGRAFTREAIASAWEHLLLSTITQEFARWRSKPRRSAAVRSAVAGSLSYTWRQLRRRIPASIRRSVNPNFPQ
jgi:hypothetical protein